MNKKRSILVTGGAGFIGSHMADRLVKEGYKVIIFDNFSTGKEGNIPKGTIFIQGDVSKKKDVENLFKKFKFDVIFHIAGNASIIKSFTNPLADFNKNFVGTVNVISESVKYNVPRFLYASSMTIYGHQSSRKIKESNVPAPISYYGISKYAAERFVHATSARIDLKNPINVTSFRMFNVYGPRQSLTNNYQGVMGIFIGNLLRNEPINIYGDGNQTRDLVYIDDVVNAWVKSINNPKTFGKAFNIGYGKDVSVNKMVKILLTKFEKDKKYPILKKPGRPGEQRFTCSDTTLVKSALGWKAKTNLDLGLAKTIEWAKKEYGRKEI